MADDSKRPIIIRRVKKSAGGHHGGVWKIAYADFVTAMMAFFLLMWLLGTATTGQLHGIADYFKTPLMVALSGGAGSGDANNVVKGGGPDFTRSAGQIKQGDLPNKRKTALKAAQAELERQEHEKLKALKQRVEAAIEANPSIRQFKEQMLLDITTEGLRIQIVDEQSRPMFASGRAQLLPHTRDILRDIARALNDVPNRVSLSGHTDATPYASGEKSYSNWELSADRANASRRELIAGGMDEKKILRVVGLSSAVPLERDDPSNPINRRISIIVMNKEASDAVAREDSKLEASADQRVGAEGVQGGQPGAK